MAHGELSEISWADWTSLTWYRNILHSRVEQREGESKLKKISRLYGLTDPNTPTHEKKRKEEYSKHNATLESEI